MRGRPIASTLSRPVCYAEGMPRRHRPRPNCPTRPGPTPLATALSGEERLVVELLRQVIHDARRPGEPQADAVAFLRDPVRLDWWIGLLGADAALIGPALRQAAGLEG